VWARAVAVYESNGTNSTSPCIIALSPDDSAAVEFSGEVTMDMECGIAVHSGDSKALKVSGTTHLDTTDVCVEGGIEVSGTFTHTDGYVDLENDPNLTVSGWDGNGAPCSPTADPLADLAAPSFNPSCNSNHTDFKIDSDGSSHTVYPGVYCNGIEISGNNNNITFMPGEYILAGKGFKLSGAYNDVDGTGLFFYNTDNDGDHAFGDIDFSGSDNTIDIVAARSSNTDVRSEYHGVLFYNDRGDPHHETDPYENDRKFKVAGEVTSDMDGIIYMPAQQVEYSGQSSNGHTCGAKIIADVVHFNGNSGNWFTPGVGCASNEVEFGPIDIRVRLKE
jgi:hypothetical protein